MRTFQAKNTALIFGVIGLIFVLSGCATQPSPQPSAGQHPPVAITAVDAAQTEDGVEVVVTADQPLTFSSLKQPDPPAVVLYFPNATVGQVPAEQATAQELIPRILAQDGNGGKTARVEVQLASDAAYVARQEGHTVRLTFTRSAPAVSEPDTTVNPVIQPVAALSPTVPVRTAAVSGAQGAAAWVNKIDFLSEAEGRSTLSIGTTQTVEYRVTKKEPKKLEIRLLNTRIPEYRQRPLITTRFTSAVDRVVPYQAGKQSSETIIAVELREAVPYVTEQTGNLLLVHFEASGIPPKPMEQAQLPAWKQALNSNQLEAAASTSPATIPVALGAPDSTPAPPPPPPSRPETAGEEDLIREDIEIRSLLAPRQTRYTGEKIALDFYETDIKNVFRILREVSGKNFAIDKDVTGKVTMTLDKPVPWDQVLDLVLRMNQLGLAREGDIMRIATLETLKKEDDLRTAKLEALKKAREDAKALEPLVTRYFPVSYANAKSDVQPHIEKILSSGRGSVTVDDKNNQVIVTDTVAIVRQAEQIIARIDKVTSQVVIEARVVEVIDNFSKELGITWNMSYGPGIIPGLNWNATTDAAMNFPSQSDSNIGISFSRLSGVPFVLNARLNALETTGQGRILSSPKILTLDNKKAKIKQGVEVGYLERDSAGGSSVKFKNVDLLLEVTPHVTPDNRVSLVIFITKNDISGILNGVPSVASNEAQTELLVNDGDTVVIGGIIKKSENMGEEAFPGLSKIPLLGWAFKNRTDKTQSNELLIFITPRIVQLEQAATQSNL